MSGTARFGRTALCFFCIFIKMKKRFIPSVFLFGLAAGCTADKAFAPMTCENQHVTYSQTILPIINARCAMPGCPGAGSATGDFTAYAGVKAKVDNGSFRLRVIDLRVMPPLTQAPLSDEDIFRITCWLDAGAPDN